QLLLHLEDLGRGFLNEACAVQGIRQLRVDAPGVLVRVLRQPQAGERGPGGVDEAAELLLRHRAGVPHAHPQSACQEVSGPAAADRARADAGDGVDGVDVANLHAQASCVVAPASVSAGWVAWRLARCSGATGSAGISRAWSGVAPEAPRSSMMPTARSVSCAFVALTPLDR